MARISVNFKGVHGQGERVPVGVYRAKVAQIEQKASKAGNQMLTWRFKVLGGEWDGASTFGSTNLEPQTALFNLKSWLMVLGWTADELRGDEEGNLDIDTEALIDLECGVVVTRNDNDYVGVTKLVPVEALDELAASVAAEAPVAAEDDAASFFKM